MASSGDEAAAANLDDGDTRADFEQRHEHERHGPRGRPDLMSDAEATNGGLEAVVDGEGEGHPRADSENEQAAGDPADAGKGDTAVAGPDVRGKTADDAERQA